MTDPQVHVLVVDDNRDFTESLSLLMELAGFRTVTAYDGDSALTLARQCRPLVIVTDLAMPGRDGFRLLASLRAEPACRGAFVAAVSGWGGMATSREVREAGFDAYFMKPCEHADLMRAVADAVHSVGFRRESASCRGAAAGAGGTGY